MKVEKLGQVFTPEHIVERMIGLIKNGKRILEPSSGDGAFYYKLIDKFHDVTAVEIDKDVAHPEALNKDFFVAKEHLGKFDTIIGNPPYVAFKNVPKKTRDKLDLDFFDSLSNLYLFFIKESIDMLEKGGELIFVVPRDFIKATSARKLNEYIYEKGTITYMEDLGESNVFKGANPNTVIFRFEKDLFERKLNDGRTFYINDGQLFFLKDTDRILFNELFYVKVGAASGANDIFSLPGGNVDFVYSGTVKDMKTKKMHYNVINEQMLKHKNKLIKRKIRKFDQNNWFMWGRNYYKSDEKRIYVNLKTRNLNPFYTHECKAYDGSVLAIFPKKKYSEKELNEIIKMLNNDVDWEELGFYSDGRFMFNQRSLENCLLPSSFKKFI